MKRVLVLALVACGSRTGLDGADAATSAPSDAVAPIADAFLPDAPVVPGCTHLAIAEFITGTRLGFDAMYVYFGGKETSIRRVPKSGGAVQTIANDTGKPPFFISNIVVDHDDVYWSSPNDSELRRVSKAGGTVTTIPCSITRPGVNGSKTGPCFGAGFGSLPIAIVEGNAFMGSQGELLRLPLAGGQATILDSFDTTTQVHKGEKVHQLAVRDGRAFWIAAGVLFARPLDGSPGFHLGSFDSSANLAIQVFAVDSKRVYFSQGAQTISSVAVDGTGLATFAVQTYLTGMIDADEQSIYSYGNHTLRRTSKTNETTVDLEMWNTVGLLQVDECLYYVDGDASAMTTVLIRTEK